MKKIEGKKYLDAPTPPEDEAICLFAGLLANPDMPLSHSLINSEEEDVRFLIIATTAWLSS